MDQHKKRRLRRWHFHIRRDRFLTLLGSLIIFATFVVKEGIGENLKDLVSSIEAAENLYVLRDDIASSTNHISRIPLNPPLTEDDVKKMRRAVEDIDEQSQKLMNICWGLANSLPDRERHMERIHQVNADLNPTDHDNIRRASMVGKTKEQLASDGKAIYDESLEHLYHANALRYDLLKEADDLKEGRTTRYRIAKLLSYILFTIGWGLAFYGQLSSKGPSPPLPSD